MPESGAADIALDAELDAPHRVRGCAKLPIFRYKTVKNAKKTAVKRRDCANFPKRAIDIDCPHFGPDTPGHAAIGPTNFLKTFSVAPENVRICPCIWTLTVKNRPKNGQDADRCCDVAWAHTGAPTMLGCLVWVPASSACPNSQGPRLPRKLHHLRVAFAPVQSFWRHMAGDRKGGCGTSPYMRILDPGDAPRV